MKLKKPILENKYSMNWQRVIALSQLSETYIDSKISPESDESKIFEDMLKFSLTNFVQPKTKPSPVKKIVLNIRKASPFLHDQSLAIVLFFLGFGRTSVFWGYFLMESLRAIYKPRTQSFPSLLRLYKRWKATPMFGSSADWRSPFIPMILGKRFTFNRNIFLWQKNMWMTLTDSYADLIDQVQTYHQKTAASCYDFLGIDNLFPKNSLVAPWRTAFNNETLREITAQSYESAKMLAERAPLGLRPLFDVWHHDLSYQILLIRARNKLLASAQPTTILLGATNLFSFTENFETETAPRKNILETFLVWTRKRNDKVIQKTNARLTQHYNGKVHYIVIEDSTTGMSFLTGLKLLEQLRQQQINTITLTSSRYIRNTLVKQGFPTICLNPRGNVPLKTRLTELRRFQRLTRYALDQEQNTPEAEALKKTLSTWCTHWTGLVYIKSKLRQVFSEFPPRVLISIGEGLPLAITAGRLAMKRYQAPWYGWNHLLIANTPDCHYFPAQNHVFYGEQALEIFLNAGGALEKSCVVGAPGFDASLHRDANADLNYVRALLKNWNGEQRLVVIGTENRYEQHVEIFPTLRCLSEMDNVHTVLKLHPDDQIQDFKDEVKKIDPSGKKITIIKRCDLHALLSAADLLITQYSNIIINAAILKTPILVFDFKDSRRLDFVAEGIADGVFTEAELKPRIEALLYDQNHIASLLNSMEKNLYRFNYLCDGKSVSRLISNIQQKQEPAVSL